MDLHSFTHLLTPSGQQVLAEAMALQPREEDYLAHYQSLSRRYPTGLAQAALEIAIQRRRATEKFPLGERLYFTREALEQASSYPLANYRAARFQGFSGVLDMGCSAGGDALALAARLPVLGLDRDALRLAMARANLDAAGLGERVSWIQADLDHLPLYLRHLRGHAVFFDPARRLGGRRVFSVKEYSPPLSTVRAWQKALPAVGVKLSPGVRLDELARYTAEVEFISLGGNLKEAVLWFGPLQSALRRATVLPGNGETVPGAHSLAADRLDSLPSLPLCPPRTWLIEPDPAVLRAGLVTLLGEQLGAAQLDADIAYLTADHASSTPFARSWKVLDWFPFQLKRLRTYLRLRGVGQVTIKKRGSPLEPDVLRRQLRLQGPNNALVFLTHLRGQPIVILAEEKEELYHKDKELPHPGDAEYTEKPV